MNSRNLFYVRSLHLRFYFSKNKYIEALFYLEKFLFDNYNHDEEILISNLKQKWIYDCIEKSDYSNDITKKLKPGGKILIISFHSLEDRIVKYFFSNFSKNKSKPSRYFPDNRSPDNTLFKTYRNKVFTPSKLEIEKNNRSRSAKLRFAVRSNNRFEYPYDLIKKFKRFLDLEATNV